MGTAQPCNDTPNRRWTTSLKSVKWEPIILLLPAIIALLVLTIYPLIYGLRISFIDFDLLSSTATGEWNWFANYTDLFKSKQFWEALKVTFEYAAMAITAEMIVGFGLALLLNQELRGINIARGVIISAMVMTPVIVGTAWRLMYNPGWGLVNYFMGKLGIPEQAFLANAKSVIPALVLVDVWEWSPLVMLIILAALQCVPVEEYEAATVDGATDFQKFLYVTLPTVKPAIAVALLIRTMDCFRTFDTIFAMTGGGPGTSSQNLNLYSYYQGLEFYHISSATAVAVISLVIITFICTLIMKFFGVELWKSQAQSKQ